MLSSLKDEAALAICTRREDLQMDITYYAGMSLDGFIAKPNGDVSWLDELGIPMEETGYEEFFSKVDCLAAICRSSPDRIQSFK